MAMPTKIRLTTNFSFRTSGSGELILPVHITTIGDLLLEIGRQIDFVFIDAERTRLRNDIEVVINGKDVLLYPAGLGTTLTDGDSIAITLMPLGGG